MKFRTMSEPQIVETYDRILQDLSGKINEKPLTFRSVHGFDLESGKDGYPFEVAIFNPQGISNPQELKSITTREQLIQFLKKHTVSLNAFELFRKDTSRKKKKKLDTYEMLDFLLTHCNHSLNFGFNSHIFDFDGIMKEYLVWMKKNFKDVLEEQERRHSFPVFQPNGADAMGNAVFIKVEFIPKRWFRLSRTQYTSEGHIHNSRKCHVHRHVGKPNEYCVLKKLGYAKQCPKTPLCNLPQAKKKSECANFYDVANFESGTLDNLSKKIFGDTKEKFGLSDADVDIENLNKQPIEIQNLRCELDAFFTWRLSLKIVETTKKLGISVRKYNSPATLAEAYLIANVEEKYLKPFSGYLEKHPDQKPSYEITGRNPRGIAKVLDYAWHSFRGGIFHNTVKGRIDNCSELDLSGAYPTNALNFPDMVNGDWISSEVYHNEASYGFYHVKMEFDGWTAYRTKDDLLYYPRLYDLTENYITKPELEFYRSRGIHVEIIDGIEFFHNQEPVHFLRVAIKNLIDLKNSFDPDKDFAEYNMIKTVCECASYGKFAQSRDGLGILFNSVIASYATALTRVNILELAETIAQPENVFEIATDAVISRLRPEIEMLNDGETWTWTRDVKNLPRIVTSIKRINEEKFEFTNSRGDKIPLKRKTKLVTYTCGIKHEHTKQCPSVPSVVILQTGLTCDLNGNLLRARGIPIRQTEKVKPNRSLSFNERELVMKSKRPVHRREAEVLTIRTVDGKEIDVNIEDINQFQDFEKIFAYDDRKMNWEVKKLTKEILFRQTIRGKPWVDEYIEELERDRSLEKEIPQDI